jgi:hypothetical protein
MRWYTEWSGRSGMKPGRGSPPGTLLFYSEKCVLGGRTGRGRKDK